MQAGAMNTFDLYVAKY